MKARVRWGREEHPWPTQFPGCLLPPRLSWGLCDVTWGSPTPLPSSRPPFAGDACGVIGTWPSHVCLPCSGPLVPLGLPLIHPTEWRKPMLSHPAMPSNKGWRAKLNTPGHQLLTCNSTSTEHLHKQNVCQVNMELIASQNLKSSWALVLGLLLPTFFPVSLSLQPHGPAGGCVSLTDFSTRILSQVETSKLLTHLLPHSVWLPLTYHILWKFLHLAGYLHQSYLWNL